MKLVQRRKMQHRNVRENTHKEKARILKYLKTCTWVKRYLVISKIFVYNARGKSEV